MTEPDTVPFRILPQITDHNRDFWQGGAHDELRFWRCQDCTQYIHPPLPLCPYCHGKNLRVEPVSGRATLTTYSINHQSWMPGPDLPYCVAIVEIVEDPRVRLTTNIVGCAHEELEIGMALRVVFEHHADPDDAEGGVWLPLFTPEREA